MNNLDECYINHEVRIRLLEENNKETKEILKEIRSDIKSNFLWTLGIIFTLIITIWIGK